MTKWRKLNCAFLKSLDIKGKVLDLGCGPKEFSYLYGDDLTTVEFDPKFKPDIVADLNKSLPIDSNKYDYVILNNVLEHIKNPRELIKECHRVLKKSGTLVILVPFIIKLHQEPFDYYRYTEFALRELLSDFAYVDIKTSGNLKDVKDTVLQNYFSVQSRLLRPLYWITYFLTMFDAYHKTYPLGYHVITRKN